MEPQFLNRVKSMIRSVPSSFSSFFAPLSLLLLGGAYAFSFLGLGSRWWFEDDPALFAYTSGIGSPTKIFVDPEVLRHFTTGKALVPMQLLSYWLDVRLAGFSLSFAYAHQMCSFLLVLLIVYFIFVRILHDKVSSFSISFLWMLLPSTTVVLQFLATRHYLEGLVFTSLAVLVLATVGFSDHHLGWFALAVVLSCSAIAMLYKEIYAAVIPPLLLFYSWANRECRLAVSTSFIICVYVAFRFWVLGSAFNYDMPFLTVPHYLKFLSKLPYTLTSNYGGYLFYGLIVALCVHSAHKKPPTRRIILCCLTLVVLSLVAILPVSYPLYGTIRVPDPWYRITFLLNSIVLFFGSYLAVSYLPRRMLVIFFLLAMGAFGAGAVKTQRLWVAMTASAEREGKFYLSNPDKVVLSEQAAWWFLPGLDWMYGVKKPHYILLKDLTKTTIELPIWRFRDGRFVPDNSWWERNAGKP